MEKKTNFLKKIVTFSAGMVTMAILVTAIIPASAAGNQIAYNQVGIRTFGEQRVTAGEPYMLPMGKRFPPALPIRMLPEGRPTTCPFASSVSCWMQQWLGMQM